VAQFACSRRQWEKRRNANALSHGILCRLVLSNYPVRPGACPDLWRCRKLGVLTDIPAYIEPEWRAFLADAKIGHRMGKGYINEPHGECQGHGYNVYQVGRKTTRHLRFGWSYGASSLDGKPALIMRYAAFENWAGRNDLVDEVRRAGPGVMMGIYFTRDVVPGFTPRAGNGRTEPEVFILRGPVGRTHTPNRN